MITLIALSRLIPMKGNYRIRKKHGQDISRGDGARLSFPVETSEPELESRAMKNKQTETEIEIWPWSHTSFNRRGTVFSSNQSDLL